MLLTLIFLLKAVFSNPYTMLGSEDALLEIKDFLDTYALYETYKEDPNFTIYNQNPISFKLESGTLNIHLFSVDQKDLLPFFKKNFNKFVHKDLLLNLTKLVYDYIINEVQFFPLNPNLDSNYALCSYERTDGALVVLPLFRIKLN